MKEQQRLSRLDEALKAMESHPEGLSLLSQMICNEQLRYVQHAREPVKQP